MKIVAVIAARGGSKRLKHKNIYPLFDKPMLAWAIEACQRSKYICDVLVSSDDSNILSVADEFNAICIDRPSDLSDDFTPKMEVIRHADKWYKQNYNIEVDIVISVQANSPELNTKDIDDGVEMLLENSLYEVISVGKDMIQNASFRVIKQSSLYNTFLSAHIGVIVNQCIDVHTLDDVEAIEARHKNINQFTQFITQ